MITEQRRPRDGGDIIATDAEGTFRDIIRIISAGGLFVWTQKHIAVGQPIVLKFPLFQTENVIQVSGMVVRRDAKGFTVKYNEPIEKLQGSVGRVPKTSMRLIVQLKMVIAAQIKPNEAQSRQINTPSFTRLQTYRHLVSNLLSGYNSFGHNCRF